MSGSNIEQMTINIGKHVVEIYDSIEDLPVVRWHKYNKYMLYESGIGSDLESICSHCDRIARYINSDPAKALQEVENMRQNLYFIDYEVMPKHSAFAALIKSVDGKLCDDLSDHGLRATFMLISDGGIGEIEHKIASIKKKITEELSNYFPKQYNSIGVQDYYETLYRRVMLLLDSITGKEVDLKTLKELTDTLITYSDPIELNGEKAVDVLFDKSFERTCILLSQHLNISKPKELTTLEYCNAIETLQEQLKAKTVKNKR